MQIMYMYIQIRRKVGIKHIQKYEKLECKFYNISLKVYYDTLNWAALF